MDEVDGRRDDPEAEDEHAVPELRPGPAATDGPHHQGDGEDDGDDQNEHAEGESLGVARPGAGSATHRADAADDDGRDDDADQERRECAAVGQLRPGERDVQRERAARHGAECRESGSWRLREDETGVGGGVGGRGHLILLDWVGGVVPQTLVWGDPQLPVGSSVSIHLTRYYVVAS